MSEPRPRQAALEVLDPGLLTTVQDQGRPGYAHLGVPRSGAVDTAAHALGNRLVGNDPGAAGLEVTATGAEMRLTGPGVIAVTGARSAVVVAGRRVPWGAAVPVPAGGSIKLGPAEDGLRSYLAVAGGLLAPMALGSRATDLLSGLGPEPAAAGSRYPVGEAVPIAEASWSAEAAPERRSGVVRVLLGPRADWFAAGAVAALQSAPYTVGASSNRIGIRLEGPRLERARPGAELPSEPMVLGAIQVPPSGQPVVFLHDHPTTGGYPVIGVVAAADLVVCGQARPGEEIVFQVARQVS